MLEIGSQGLAHARQILNHRPSPYRNTVCGEEHAVTLSRSVTDCCSSEQVSSVLDRWGVSMGRQKESTGFEVRWGGWGGGFWEGVSLCVIANHRQYCDGMFLSL